VSACVDSASRLRVLVLGYIVRRPLGGGTWPTLQYALGLARLGHEVYFLEDSDDYLGCYDPSRHVTDADPSFGLRYAKTVFERVGLGSKWAYYDAHTGVWHGPCSDRVLKICANADLLLNVSGINPIRPWLAGVPRRAYIDTDPAFEQVRQLTDEHRRALALQHNVFFTLGENIPAGKAERLPEPTLIWRATRQPVVLDAWPVTEPPADGRFTTVMLWHSYRTREYQGQVFGMKSDSFRDFFDLPMRTDSALEIAVGGPDVPRDSLRRNGWSVINPLGPTEDPWTYQCYLRESKGEFTVAKHGYVTSYCGWFSERSAHYLASGRPVITQETGFSEWLPTGEGLFSFHSVDQALDALEQVESDLARHGRSARAIAEEYFDSDRVLTDFVEAAMCAEEGDSA